MDKVMNSAGIYRVTIQRSDDRGYVRYIGQAAILRKRRDKHLGDLRKRRHKNQRLQRAFDKYGESAFAFDVLAVCEQMKTLMDTAEQAALDNEFAAFPDDVANICRDAVGSKLGVPMADATKAKIGDANRNKIRTQEHKDAVAASNRMRSVSDKTRAKMSASRMGNQNGRGHSPSPERRAQTSAQFLGTKKSPEEIERRLRTREHNRALRGGRY